MYNGVFDTEGDGRGRGGGGYMWEREEQIGKSKYAHMISSSQRPLIVFFVPV